MIVHTCASWADMIFRIECDFERERERERERDLSVQHHDLLPIKKKKKKLWNLNVEHLDSL